MVGKIIIAALGALFAFALGHEFTEISVKENQKYGQPIGRGNAYFLCIVFVFASAIIISFMIGGKSVERRDTVAFNVFVTTIIPALIGVRLGLGRPSRG